MLESILYSELYFYYFEFRNYELLQELVNF